MPAWPNVSISSVRKVAVAASAGDDGVALFPGAGEGDRGAVQVEPFARAVRNDEQAVFPQAAEQFVL